MRRRLLAAHLAKFAKASDRGTLFLLLYACAWAGASISYIPFLTILLPVRIANLIGHEAAVSWLSYIAFAGAVAASIGHIGFGYLSDLTRNRPVWIWAGLTISCALLIAVPWANSLPKLIGLIVCWQLALNMMLAPLAAFAGDHVPDQRKGLLGGLLAFAPGFGALAGAFVTLPGFLMADGRLWMIAAMVVLCVTPLLIFCSRGLSGQTEYAANSPKADAHANGPAAIEREAMLRMWLARLTVQIGEATLFAFLYLWFKAIAIDMDDNRTASVFSIILIVSAPLSLAFGAWADRRNRPLLPLIICACVSAIALAGMALSNSAYTAVGSYAVFGVASSIFLAQHSAQTLRVLTRQDRRGRDLGLFNLTNTIPSLIMPWFALTLVPYFGFSGLFWLLAALAVATVVLLFPLVKRG